MARVLNLILVILGLIGFIKSLKGRSIRKHLLYYTQISNCITFITSLMYVIIGPKDYVVVFRYTSVCMMVMTLIVTALVLVPMSRKPREFLFSGSGLFQHLLIPIVSTLSYMLLEKRAPFFWFWIAPLITLIYGLIMLHLNYTKKVEGPYPFFMIRSIGAKITSIWMVALMIVISVISLAVGYHKPMKSDIKFIFVHGLSGWGSYDLQNEFIPYWGLSSGDVIRNMNEKGYESYSASVDPAGSAWDRACELYAQLTGKRVDYGAAHSDRAGHARYGKDFSGQPLLRGFDDSRFVLIGHSFGGATIRLFSEILRNGSAEEIAYTDPSDLSDFFKGDSGKNMVALVTLAAPTNGTTAYDLYEDPSFDLSAIDIPEEYEKNSDTVSKSSKPVMDGRQLWDYASFDMHIDNALALNDHITTFDDVFYFAYPCSSTYNDGVGNITPDPEITENIFMKGSIYMSRYSGTTAGGYHIDESWQSNDGLVNEESAKAPIGAPSRLYESGKELTPGVWNIMPTVRGDHMYLQGGLTNRHDVRPFYEELAGMITALK